MKRIGTIFLALVIAFALIGGGFSDADAKTRSRSSSYKSSSSSSWGAKPKATAPKAAGSSWGSKTTTKPVPKASAKPATKPGTFGKATKTTNDPSVKRTASTSQRAQALKERKTRQAAAVAKERKALVKGTAATKAVRGTATGFAKKSSPADWKKSKSSWSSKHTPRQSVTTGNRYSDRERTVVVSRYNNVYGGYAYADPFDHMMIWSFSNMWWYNHWNSIDRSHYHNDARYHELEAKVAALEAQGVKRDATYKDKGMDEATMYSDGYMQAAKDGKLKDKDEGMGFFGYLMIFLGLGSAGLGAWWFFIRKP